MNSTPAPFPARAPTLSDVACQAGVSHQTVSRVLNAPHSVAEATRVRVLEALRDLDYRPNRAARSLARGRSGLLGLIGYSDPHYGPAQMRLAIERAARAAGYGLGVASVPELSVEEVERSLEHLLQQGVEGVALIVPLQIEFEALTFLLERLPCVLLGTPSGIPFAGAAIDQHLGAVLATRHLLELGHRNIGYIGGPDHWSDAQARREGFIETLNQAGLQAVALEEADWSAAGGFAALHRLLERAPRCSAVLVANDQMALGALRAARVRGLWVPEDLSLVGFDNLPESEYFEPPLTTVHQDFRALGERGIELLLNQLRGSAPLEPVTTYLEPTLVVRSSTLEPVGEGGEGGEG